MLRFPNRPTAGRAAYDARVLHHVAALELLADAEDWAGITSYVKANPAWSAGVKASFAKVQGRKCGYCERLMTDHGDVEHYRPKSAIFTLRHRGRERDGLNNVKGRSYREFPSTDAWNSGYWWLSYSWSNYLVACGRCNQQWKNALFPVNGGIARRPARPDDLTETALLLDPYGDEKPADHLTFTAAGDIGPHNRSVYGEATIEVCGLDRPSLVASRLEKASRTYHDIEEVALQLRNHPVSALKGSPERATQVAVQREAVRPALGRLLHAGGRHHPHAGMVRILVAQRLSIDWEELTAHLDKSQPTRYSGSA